MLFSVALVGLWVYIMVLEFINFANQPMSLFKFNEFKVRDGFSINQDTEAKFSEIIETADVLVVSSY